jgi:heat shock protein HslJ
MKMAQLSAFLLFFIFLLSTCDTEVIGDQENDSILGNWDVEGGGTLYFDEDSFSASAGCNTLFGSLSIEENQVVFSLIASTLISCPEAEGNREQELVALLDSNRFNFSLMENRAQLLDADGVVVLTLIRPENASLTNAWTIISIRTSNAITSSVLDTDTGINFSEEGILTIQTACNSGQGSFLAKKTNLTFSSLAFTERACDEDRNNREKELVEAINQINSYTILRNTLTLEKDGEAQITLVLKEN